MKKFWFIGSLVVISLVMVAIFFEVSARSREIHRDMVQFFREVEAKQYERLYHHWTTEPYRKQHTLPRFVADIEKLGGPHTLKVRELFVSFRRSTLRGEVLTQPGRSFAIEFHVRKQQGHHRVYAFRIQESVEGISSSFLSWLQKKRWDQAYALTSEAFRKQVSRSQLPTWTQQQRIPQWESFSWSMVDNYSRIGRVSGAWRTAQGKAGGLSVALFREQNVWKIGQIFIESPSL